MEHPRDLKVDIHFGDCIAGLCEKVADESVDLVVTSIPFEELFTYSGKTEDVGNNGSTIDIREGRFALNLRFVIEQLFRVHRPGTICAIHIQQLLAYKIQHGFMGRRDFRGAVVDLFRAAGFRFVGEAIEPGTYPLVTRADLQRVLDSTPDDAGVTAELLRLLGVPVPSEVAIPKDPQALRNGTRVLTPWGWVAIESLRAGQQVIGSAGKSVKVLGVYPHESRQLYRVTLSDGVSIDCDGNHLWTVSLASGCVRTMTTDQMREKGCRMPAGGARFYVPLLAHPVEFAPRSFPPLDPYTLGCLLGNGSLSTRSRVCLTASEALVNQCLLPPGHRWNLVPTSECDGGKVASYALLGPDARTNLVLDILRDLGLHGLKAYEKFVPDDYLFGIAEVRLATLQGLLDTDGTVKKNGAVRFSTTSDRLKDHVCFLVESFGGSARTRLERGGKYVHRGEVRRGRPIWAVTIHLPPSVVPFRLERKISRLKERRKPPTRFVESIVSVDVAPCTCIEVDAPDQLYAIEHCVLTHNTMAQRLNLHSLQFKTGYARSSTSWAPAVNDYLLLFQKPGEPRQPVRPLKHKTNPAGWLTQEDWILWARGVWEIDPMDVLDGGRRSGLAKLKEEESEKHVCPLQLSLIRRCILLYSNPVEIQPDVLVLDPFMGIGSTACVAIECGRNALGFELKESYHRAALDNVNAAFKLREMNQVGQRQADLFPGEEAQEGAA